MNSKESTESRNHFCKKGVFEPPTSCVINQDSSTAMLAMKTLVTVRIFKLSPVHASVIYQFP